MVNVNEFRLFTQFVSNKAQSGNTIRTTDFNRIANQAQMQVFEKDFQTYLQTDMVTEFLGYFLKNQTTSVPVTGTLPYPSDFQHVSSIRSYYVRPGGASTEIPVIEVKNASWGDISTSQLLEPSKRFPKFSEFGNGIRFLPKNIGSVMLDYFKTPVAPVWGFTVASGREVYSAAASTDFEWDIFSMNNVASVYLQLIGCNLKDGELLQFSNQFQQETNSVL
ncbi:MAG: hypothetical protein V4721_10170 [Bacteroidota bacterium]